MSKRTTDPLEVPTAPGTPDASGTPFNPERHAKYRTGRGMKTKDGNWFWNGGGASQKPPVKTGGTPAPAAPVAKAAAPAPVAPSAPVPVVSGGASPSTAMFKGWEAPPPAPPAGEGSATPPEAAPAPTPAPPPETPPGSTLGTVPGEQVDASGAVIPPAPAPAPTATDAKARAIVTAIEASTRMIFGPDMEHTAQERAELSAAWGLYFETSGGGPDVPPWAGVALGYFGVFARRSDKPTFRKRCSDLWAKLTGGKG